MPLDRTAQFLYALDRTVQAHRIRPILQDILLVPEDPDCLLSSSHGLRGFLANVAFEQSSPSGMRRIERGCAELETLCADFGGRVTLCKNVHADSTDLERMYGPQLDAYFALKRRVDPLGILSNRFLERLFPERMRASRSRPKPAA